MKKIIGIALVALAAALCIAASDFQPQEMSFQYQMNGAWLPNVHPLHVSQNNYTTLQNLRPTETGYETVEGYSKINTTLIPTPLNLHHFSKTNESHVVAKISSGGSVYLYQNTTAIPSAGDFSSTSLYTVASGAGSFANGQRGTLFYTDGTYNLVWGGDEFETAAFLSGDDLNTLQDFTENVNNDLTDQIANVGSGGDDASAVLLLHMNGLDASTTFTDDGATGHTPSANGDAQLDTSYKKYGTAAGVFDGSGDYVSVADHADWNFSTGLMTIDGWVSFDSTTGQDCLYSQALNTDYVVLYQDHDTSKLYFNVMVSGSRRVSWIGTWAPVANTWYHWAVIRGWGGNANDWAVTINGTAIATGTKSETLPDIAAPLYIGHHEPASLIDLGTTGHGFTVNGTATSSNAQKKFGEGSLYFPGDGSGFSSSDSVDWDVLTTTNATLSAWVKHTDHVGTEAYFSQDETSLNDGWEFRHIDGSGLSFTAATGGGTIVNLVGGEITDTNWHWVVLAKVGNEYGIYLDGTQTAYVNDSSTDTYAAPLTLGHGQSNARPFDGYMDDAIIYHGNLYSATPNAGLTDTITTPTATHTPDSPTKLLLRGDVMDLGGSLDEYRVSKGVARWTSTFTPQTTAYFDGGTYFYVGSPYKLNGIKSYIISANTETSSLTGEAWTGSGWTSLTITDNTASGGISHAQTGTITWTYSEDPKVIYVNGKTLYLYRFALSAGKADVYKVTVSAPLQPIRDVWNEAPRTCTSFQSYVNSTTKNSDYTFPVQAKDSTVDNPYAATIGGLTSADHLEIFFDDRTMGINFTMLSGLVNAAAAKISDVQFWDGTQYTSTGYFSDGTLDTAGDSSFAKSGVVWWNPPDSDEEHSQEKFGIKGYGYKFTLSGTLTPGTGGNGTSIDYVSGITSPLKISGYDLAGTYNGRVMLINGNRVDYSQTYVPWAFNGVDSSNDGALSLYFGDDNDIVATTNLFNRYGSNLIETMVLFKKNSLSILAGSQPYPQYSDPFVIKEVSKNIGCAAPQTVNSYQMEVGEGLRMSIVVWLDFSGPYYYNGAEPSRIKGVENFFDKSESTSINYSYIDQSIAYIDSVNDQWNLLIPVGASTVPNKWLVYDFRYKKWFEKVPAAYPTVVDHVVDTNGARYNYGFLSTGQMLRLDNTQAWDGTAISQSITTGYFSPSVKENDGFGFWTRSKLRAVRLLSGPITEDQDVTITIYNDGSTSTNSVTVPLDSSGVISKNSIHSGNLDDAADFFQINFAASSSSEKWKPLAWGYKAVELRED